jgi:hypothetical protein
LTASSRFLSSCLSAHFLLNLVDFCTLAVDPPVRVAFQGRIRFACPSVDSVLDAGTAAVDVEATGSSAAVSDILLISIDAEQRSSSMLCFLPESVLHHNTKSEQTC